MGDRHEHNALRSLHGPSLGSYSYTGWVYDDGRTQFPTLLHTARSSLPSGERGRGEGFTLRASLAAGQFQRGIRLSIRPGEVLQLNPRLVLRVSQSTGRVPLEVILFPAAAHCFRILLIERAQELGPATIPLAIFCFELRVILERLAAGVETLG
jgi:hypothetical protein